MKITALLLALHFAAVSPAAVVVGVAEAQPDAVIIFDTESEPQPEEQPTISDDDVEVAVVELEKFFAPVLRNPVSDLVFNTPVVREEEEVLPEEDVTVEEETDAVLPDSNEDQDYDGSSADESLDKGFVGSGTMDTSKPVLQKPSGTVVNGYVAPSRIKLTDEERDLIERVVMAEVSGRSREDALAVAQCIYDRCVTWDQSVEKVLFTKYAFADPTYRYTPTSTVKKAVSDVFDNGVRLTEEKILYFYAVRIANPGASHETKRCLVETDLHRYFGP